MKSPLAESAKVSLILPRDRSFSLNPSLKGQVEQWGSVHRKKDKKHQNPVQDSKDRNPHRDRADSRGGRGRGGRGGRGSYSRGGAPSRGGQNGHRVQSFSRSEPVDSTTSGTDNAGPTTPASKDENAPSTYTWGSDLTPVDQVQDFSSQTTSTGWGESTPAWGESTPGWGESTQTWGVDTKPNGTPSPAVQAKPLTSVPGPPKPTPKTPANSKLSWAQVARCASFYVEIFSIFLIRCIVHKRNPHRHPLLPPYNCNQPLLPHHLPVYLNSHPRSKKLTYPQNPSLPYQPLGRNLLPCKILHGKKNLRNQ